MELLTAAAIGASFVFVFGKLKSKLLDIAAGKGGEPGNEK